MEYTRLRWTIFYWTSLDKNNGVIYKTGFFNRTQVCYRQLQYVKCAGDHFSKNVVYPTTNRRYRLSITLLNAYYVIWIIQPIIRVARNTNYYLNSSFPNIDLKLIVPVSISHQSILESHTHKPRSLAVIPTTII